MNAFKACLASNANTNPILINPLMVLFYRFWHKEGNGNSACNGRMYATKIKTVIS